MMMMPFIRLLAIYAIVGAAIFAFLKRDDLAEYFAAPEAEVVATTAAAQTPPVQPAPAVVQPVPTPQPTATPAPSYSAPPAFGTQITPQYFGQAAAPAAPPPRARPAGNLVARWNKAREIYGQRNTTEAARLYEALTADFPDNADLHGETGNLYYNLGQFGKAAAHYFRVGELATARGDSAMANAMQTLLQRISPTKARQLQALIAAGQ